MTEKTTEKRDRIAEAAEKADAAVEIFEPWLFRVTRRTVSSGQRSHWASGLRPVPEIYIINYLRERLGLPPIPVPDSRRAPKKTGLNVQNKAREGLRRDIGPTPSTKKAASRPAPAGRKLRRMDSQSSPS